MNTLFNWGIVSTGMIAGAFARALADIPKARLLAVASRTKERAGAFAAQWHIPRVYDRYDDLFNDPDIDIIYVATPHSFHYRDAHAALQAGKHVLCEKAFTLNAAQAETLIRLARQKGLFLMEAMWTRFIPAVAHLRKLVNEGTYGPVLHFTAALCKRFDYDPNHRLFAPHLGGGALLDLGVYPLYMASMLMAESPQKIDSSCHLAPTGVDDHVMLNLTYSNGRTAQLLFSSRFSAPAEALVSWENNWIRLHKPFYRPIQLTLGTDDGQEEILSFPCEGNGYVYEAQAVMEAIGAGHTEHPDMPLSETLELMRLMDGLRREWGVSYPGEDPL